MRRQFVTTSLMSAITCLSTSLFAQSTQSPPDVPRTQVGEAFDGVRNAVDNTRNALNNAQNNVQNAAQPGANARVQGNVNGQQLQLNSGLQGQSNLLGQVQGQSTIQSSSGTVQRGTITSSGSYDSAGGMQQTYSSPQTSNRVYTLRHDASGREYICVNGQAVYFDNTNSISAHSQRNAMNPSEQRRAGYGSYDAQSGQNNQTQTPGQAAPANQDTRAQDNTQNRDQDRTQIRPADSDTSRDLQSDLNAQTDSNSGVQAIDKNLDAAKKQTDRVTP